MQHQHAAQTDRNAELYNARNHNGGLIMNATNLMKDGLFATRALAWWLTPTLPIRTWIRPLWRAVAMSLALVGSVAGAVQATDIGFDPSHFAVRYSVNGVSSPVYKVEADVYNLNTSQTPFLLPCGVEEFGFDIFAASTADSNPVYWAATVSFFQLKQNNTEKQIVSNGCLGDTSFNSVTGQVTGVLNPGTSAEAGFTPISSVGQFCQFQFQPIDLKKNTPVRMNVELSPFADPGFTTPVTDTNSSNNVISFWVKRAC